LTARKPFPQKAVVLRFFFLFFRTKYLSKKKKPPRNLSFLFFSFLRLAMPRVSRQFLAISVRFVLLREVY